MPRSFTRARRLGARSGVSSAARPLVVRTAAVGAVLAFAAACGDEAFTAPSAPTGGPALALGLPGTKAVDTLQVGETVQLSAASLPRRRGQQVAGPVVWSTSNAQVATVSGTGLVRGVAPGTSVVRAQNGVGSDSVRVIVLAAAAAAPPPLEPVPAPASTTTSTSASTSVAGTAELPRTYLNTAMPARTGQIISVPAGGDLQAALDAAQPGDEVVLPAGATYVGNFVLRPKAGMTAGQWITVRTAGQLPAEGTRVGPADAAQMPKLLTPNFGAAVQTAAHAQGWRLTGLEIGLAPSTTSATALVLFGSGGADQNTLAQVPSRLVLDRSYVHAPPAGDVRRCIALNSASTAVIDSHVSECHSHNGDSQAIVGWNGPGPFKIANNRLEGAHEVIVLGGADPSVPGLVPGDVEIRRNHVTRPLSWKGVWGVKNLVEFKAGQRVLLEANVFENSWADGQSYAFMFWSANADGHALWSITQDVTFRYNVVRNVADGFNLADRYNASLPRARRITIAHNVLTGLGAQGGGGRLVLVSGQLEGVTVANNTGFGGASDVLFGTTDQPIPSFVFRDNVTGGHSTLQSGMGNGVLAMQALQIPATSVRGNVFAAGKGPGAVPAGNAYAPSQSAVGFVDLAGGNLALSAASPFRTSSTGGSTPGADVAMVRQLTAGVVR